MGFSIKNITGHAASSIAGVATGALQAAIMGAATSFAQTGNTTDWKQYAWAGAAAAAPIIIGALYAPAKAQAPAAPDPRAAIMAQVDAALAQAAQKAMEAEAAKITGQVVQPQPELHLE